MSIQSIGDLALNFQSTRANAQIKSDLSRLNMELASGKKSDLGAATSGDYGPLVAIERSLRFLGAFATANAEATLFASTTQNALETIQDQTSDFGSELLVAASSASMASVGIVASNARVQVEMVLSTLNTQVAGRSVFAGTATDSAAVIDADTLMTALQSLTAAETSAADLETTLDAWFDTPGGGFDSLVYLGSASDLAPMQIAAGESASVGVKADEAAFRTTLKGFAMAALIDGGALAGFENEQIALTKRAGETLLTADNDLAVLRAEIGMSEAQIDQAAIRNTAEISSMEIARSAITSADPYATATELETVSAQLEMLYTLTARLSRLNLSDYLR